VTGSSAFRSAEERPVAGDGMPDPWGVRRAEQLLTSLEGVLSARVVTTPLGEVAEIHILASSALNAKQVVRNVESALLAHLGVKVDHRKISVAQTADVKPLEALEAGVVRERAMRRAVLFEGVAVTTASRPYRVVVSVTLSHRDEPATATEEVADTLKARLEGTAKATAALLERWVDRSTLVVDGITVVDALDRRSVMVAVRAMSGRNGAVLTGTAEAGEGLERAAVFAVLDATNRWAEMRRA
jgi:hypothetical protein